MDDALKLAFKAANLGAEDLQPSTRKRGNSTWMVKYKKKWYYIGNIYEGDFLTHGDKERQKAYLEKARKKRDRNGKLTHRNKKTANYWDINLLWT